MQTWLDIRENMSSFPNQSDVWSINCVAAQPQQTLNLRIADDLSGKAACKIVCHCLSRNLLDIFDQVNVLLSTLQKHRPSRLTGHKLGD